jgi:taurine dioxygenase
LNEFGFDLAAATKASTVLKPLAGDVTSTFGKLPSGIEETPDVSHPIVRTHARTGRKSLYVTAGECIGIEGLPNDEGIALIEELHAHCLRPEFQYRHKWQVGDLLMWDNAASMHLAICDYELPERRLMHRTTVAGEVPF